MRFLKKTAFWLSGFFLGLILGIAGSQDGKEATLATEQAPEPPAVSAPIEQIGKGPEPASAPEPKPEAKPAPVVATQFELKSTKADQEGVVLFIETNLPDHAEVAMSISRAYYAISDGKRDLYSREYFSAKEPLAKWRQPRLLTLDGEAWKADLLKHQEEMARLGKWMAFEIDGIDDHVEATAYVHGNKTGPRFEKREYKELLDRVKNTTLVAKAELRMPHKLVTVTPVARKSRLVAGNNLEVGKSYRLLRDRVPLMPSLSGESVNDLAAMKYLPAGVVVQVLSITHRSGDPWYEVALAGGQGRGWINSIALLRDGVVAVQ